MNPAFYKNTTELIESIEDCYAKQRFTPCLVLLFSRIDIMASLDNNGRATGDAFRRWVERYLLKAFPFKCTSSELWSARCGIVHTFSARSDQTEKGGQRKVIYSWGTMDADQLTAAAKVVYKGGWVG